MGTPASWGVHNLGGGPLGSNQKMNVALGAPALYVTIDFANSK